MTPEEQPPQPPPSPPTSPAQRPPAEVAWNQAEMGAPIHPMLSIDRDRKAAFVCLPLPMREGERGGGGIRCSTKPYLVMVTPGLRQLIPLELTAIPLETEPVFVTESRWPMRQLEAFLRGTQTPLRLDEVFDEVNAIVSKYLDLGDPVESKLIAIYILMSYCFPLFDGGLPFIKLQSGPGAGKSKLCSVIAHLGFNAVHTSSISEAAIYRIGGSRSLLLLDEAEDVRKSLAVLLNASYRRGSSVLRAGSRGRLESYALWGPRVIASIAPLPDAVATRCILIRMAPSRDAAKGRLSVTDSCEDWAAIRSRIYAAMLSRWQEIDSAVIEHKETLLTNRAAEIWTPLIQIATAIEPQSPGLIKELSEYCARSATPLIPPPSFSEAERTVIAVLTRFGEQGRPVELTPTDILTAATAAGLPGATGLTVNGLGVIVKRWRLLTARVHRASGNVYQVDWARVAELAAGLS